jgi:hypothetical protein
MPSFSDSSSCHCSTSRRRHDQAPCQIASERHFLDVEPSHDRLAGTRVVSKQEPQRHPRQLAIDRLDLVRQRLQVAGGDGEHRVVLASHPDPQRLGCEPERRAVAVEGGT